MPCTVCTVHEKCYYLHSSDADLILLTKQLFTPVIQFFILKPSSQIKL
jgi:hypothetical protein